MKKSLPRPRKLPVRRPRKVPPAPGRCVLCNQDVPNLYAHICAPAGTPLGTGPVSEESIAVMESEYASFLKLRRERVMEGIGRESLSDVPFSREE